MTWTCGALQTSNAGKSASGVAAIDPELGNAQNPALSNNAFEATDQYLLPPVIGFSSPCTDGEV